MSLFCVVTLAPSDLFYSVSWFFVRMPSADMVTTGLKQCQQAQDQLEDAISGVMNAEQELRQNAREVRTIILYVCLTRPLPLCFQAFTMK